MSNFQKFKKYLKKPKNIHVTISKITPCLENALFSIW